MSFILKNVSWHNHLTNIELTTPQYGLIAIIGPNGAGKSTLMKLLSRWLQPTKGTVLFNNKPLKQLKPTELAQYIAWLPQNTQIAWYLSSDFTLLMVGSFLCSLTT